jgi:hypothetical protein
VYSSLALPTDRARVSRSSLSVGGNISSRRYSRIWNTSFRTVSFQADDNVLSLSLVLKKQQVRTLQGSLADPRSYSHYLKDIDVVYLDANFWHYLDMADGDFEQAGNQYFEEKIACVDACAEAGVKQMIYMALDNFPEDKYVPHFHAKAKGKS